MSDPIQALHASAAVVAAVTFGLPFLLALLTVALQGRHPREEGRR